jgi:hypothetical protein
MFNMALLLQRKNQSPRRPIIGAAISVSTANRNGLPAMLTHVIATGGAARADELCFDPDDNLVIVNDAEADFPFGTPFVSWIDTGTYTIVASMQFPQATNGIEQCQYDHDTGLFFLNLPEANGPGNDTADGRWRSLNRQLPPTFSRQERGAALIELRAANGFTLTVLGS